MSVLFSRLLTQGFPASVVERFNIIHDDNLLSSYVLLCKIVLVWFMTHVLVAESDVNLFECDGPNAC